MTENPQQLPREAKDTAAAARVRSLETSLVRSLVIISPILIIASWLAAGTYGQTILTLKSPRGLSEAVSSRIGLAIGILALVAIAAWWCSIRISAMLAPRIQTAASVALCLIAMLATNASLLSARVEWTLQEAVKARAPQLNFARNIVFMQQNLQSKNSRHGSEPMKQIGLVGSSQINLGIDAQQLATEAGGANVRKLCLPGMVPLQYAALRRKIAAQKFDVVVCWLSEFDFYREPNLPTNRLRWCMDTPGLLSLLSLLNRPLVWANRGDLADLAVAARVPAWRQRELFKMLAFRFWWTYDTVEYEATGEELLIGARLGNRDQGIANAKRNIERTRLLEANFAAFRQFATTLRDSGTDLLVLEGESHPATMAAYNPEFRTDTRQRLRTLSTECGFVFVEADSRVPLPLDHWLDAVHLNVSGRRRLTSFLAQQLRRESWPTAPETPTLETSTE